ncbi:hypothetical protein JCM3765_003226 [Sporobolomyces pararoseus]
MAFGSATITRTRTKTKSETTTSTKSRQQSKSSSRSITQQRVPLLPSSDSDSSSSSSPDPSSSKQAPLPRRRPRRTSTDTSDESDDPDFGAGLAEATAREVKALKEVEREKQRRALLKEYRDRGEEVPDELKKTAASSRKRSGTGQDKSSGRKKKELKPEVKALLAGLEPGKGRTDPPIVKWDPKGKVRDDRAAETEDEDDQMSEKPTKPTFDWAYKKKETEKRNKIKLDAAFFESGALCRNKPDSPVPEPLPLPPITTNYNQEFLIKHLERRWIHKSDPLAMNSQRKQLEERLNPLIRLLNVKVTVVEDGEEPDEQNPGDSDSASSSSAETDSSSSFDSSHNNQKKKKQEKNKRKHRSKSTYVVRGVDTDEEDGDGQQPRDAPDFSQEEDTDWNSDGMGGMSANWPTRKLPARNTRKTQSEMDLDREKEAEEEDVKPKITDSRKVPTLLQKKAADPEVIDLLEEPDTEPSDLETSAFLPPHQHSQVTSGRFKSERPAQEWAMEIKRQEELLKRRTESQSQSHSQSQSQSQKRTIQNSTEQRLIDEDEDEEEEDEDIDEQTLRMLKQQEAKARANEERKAKQERREQRKREEELARVKREAEELSLKEKSQEGEMIEDEGDDLEEEPAAWEVSKVKKEAKKVTLPYPVKRGRPKFVIQTLEQHRTGPHLLGDGAEIPAPINKFLRPYQREGVEFLWGQYRKNIGGILGDDMGLGKTIQVIAFLSAVMGKKGYSKFDADKRKNAINELEEGVNSPTDLGPTCLIACPASVRNNWEREFQTWGYFDVAVYEGSKEQRERTMQRFRRGYVDVLIAGMESVRDQIDDFSRLDVTLLIIDEAHRLKNPKSSLTQAFHQFPTPHRYGLTGTAIQNDLDEMWCILNYANPGHVGVRRQWQDLITRPLKHAQKKEATAAELALGRSRASALVGILLPHFWLRRTKESVQLQLPRKRDNIVLCPLTELQKDVYRRILALEEVKVILTADDPCPCGEKDPEGLPYRRGSCCDQGWTKLIFKYIVLFQKISNHLALIYPDRSELNSNADKYEQDLVWAQAAFPDDYQKRKPGKTAFLDPQLCGKWNVLKELLKHWYKNEDKVLIFSMSLKVLELLEELMQDTHYNYLVLDGKSPAEDRMQLVDQFNDPDGDKFVFLISTRAGGVGLNLKAANKVVIFDPNWNPSHDLQAMDRSHRFGQTKEVDVYRLIGAGTLEELILNRQQYKRAQAGVGYDATSERRLYSGVQGEGKDFAGELWGVKNIFKFSEHISLTERSIRQMELEELEYARIAEIENGDSPPPIPDYDDESNASGIVAEVTGLKAKDSTSKKLSPAQLERLRRQEEEQATISNILGGRITVQSDSVLGGSKVEEYRSREALRAVTGSKSKPTNKVKPSTAATSRIPPMKRKSSTTRGGNSSSSSNDEGGWGKDGDGGETPIYDPFRKVKKKQKQQ